MAIELFRPEVIQPLVPIYPIGADAVRSVLKPHLAEPVDNPWQGYLEIKVPAFHAENPYANGYLFAYNYRLSKKENEDLMLGAALAYDIFSQRAGQTKLPKLSCDFVEHYVMERRQRIATAYGNDPEKRDPKLIEEEVARRNLFVLMEREAYQALQERFAKHGDTIFDKPIFAAVIASYFLFRKGFSDKKNWEPLLN